MLRQLEAIPSWLLIGQWPLNDMTVRGLLDVRIVEVSHSG